jgi:hypothetical protein
MSEEASMSETPTPQQETVGPTPELIDTVAQIIRMVDGNHTLGAAPLAEAIVDRLNMEAIRKLEAGAKPRPSFLDRQRDAALAEIRELYAEQRKVADIVLGDRLPRGQSVGEIVKFGSDYLVEVQRRDERPTWTVVEASKATSCHFYSQEEAALYLIALRHGGDHTAVYYAGRVLGILPSDDASR